MIVKIVMCKMYFKAIILMGLNILSANTIVLEDESSRILNGNQATEQQFPYMASLQRVQANNQVTADRGHRCGGVLITYQHVLTAASCLYDVGTGGNLILANASNHRVFTGSVQLTNDSSADRVRPVANFTIHPGYQAPPAHVNDIAVVTLQTPFSNMTVVPLTIQRVPVEPPQDTICTVSGWGASNPAVITPSTSLQFANKTIYSQNLCTLLYNQMSTQPNIHSSMICAAAFGLNSAGCTGDVGNPLVCGGNLTGLLFVHNGCVISSYPELYTKVGNYTEWIRSITGGASGITPGLVLLTVLTVVQALF